MKKSFFILLVLLLSFVGCGSNSIPRTNNSYTIETESPYTITNDISTATLSINEISSDKKTITVAFSYFGENHFTYGDHYKIEVLQNNKWYSLKESETFISDVGYIVENGQTSTASYNLNRFGTLSPGHYRIIIAVTNYTENENKTPHYLSAEFDIE
ncbi:MAG: hypothetical protein IJ455_00170 [Agathobacter sp.]|nr:hypothetical protein [Agathobacter sp.]